MYLNLLPELLDHAAGFQLLFKKDFDGHFLAAAALLGSVDMPESTQPDRLGGIAKVEVVPRPGRRRGRRLDRRLDCRRHGCGGEWG